MPKTQIYSTQLDGLTDKTDCCNPALRVTLENTPPIVDIEYICNGDTNTWHKITHVITINPDGTAAPAVETSVDTGISCDEPKPDYEPIQVCRNGTIHLVTYKYKEDDSQTELSAIDTGITCNTTASVDVLINCDNTTKTITVEGTNPTQVVFDKDQVLKVAIDKTCDTAPTTRDTDMLNNCDGTTEIIAVKDEAATEVIFNDSQVLKVAIDKSCDVPVVDRNINVVDDCAGAVTATAVNGEVAKEVVLSGSTKPIEVRIKEDCTAPVIKTITTEFDCAGTTLDVDTTETVEAVINHVVYTKQCSKSESVSEIEVCVGTDTLIKKTTIDSNGTEIEVFYGDDGIVVATPAAYEIGACAVPLTQDVLTQDDCAGATSLSTVNSTVAIAGSMKTLNVRIIEDCVPNFDTEYFAGCSSVDGRKIFRKVVKNEETGAETITLVEQDGATLVTDSSTLEACSGADYEAFPNCRYDEVNDVYYKKVTFINSSDTSDNFDIWMDVDGNIVPPVAVTVDCTSSCEAKIEFERCFDTGNGVVTAQGYYTLSEYTETYERAKVIASTDPLFVVGADVITNIAGWTQVSCVEPNTIVDRVSTYSYETGINTYSAPYRSLAISAVSNDVTIDGQLLPEGMSFRLDSEQNEQHITPHTVSGTNYSVIYVI